MTQSRELNEWINEWSQKIDEWEKETGKTLLGDNILTISPPRGRIERWLDKHNHKMEFLRTLTSALAAAAGLAVLTLAGTNSTVYYRMYDERIVWDFWAAISGSYKFDEVFEEEALSYARSIFDCGCSRPFPIYQQDDDTTPEETWGKLDETGIAPPGLSIFCGNCSKDSSELN